MPGLHTLVYVSTAVVPFPESELEEILATSRRHNERNGITGVLLYHDGNVMQCLEGEDEPLHETYERIESDVRHTGCIVLLDEPIAARSFPEWQMGLLRPAESELLALSSERWRAMDAGNGAPGAGASRGLVALRSFAYRKRGRF